MKVCPNCGGQTPGGFAFCQQCGGKLGAGASAVVGGGMSPSEAIAETLAASGKEAAGLLSRSTDVEQSVPWGTLTSVNRDGTDGSKYPLRGEFVMVGRSGADVSFDDDTFMAPRHARLELTGNGARIVPLDTLNGVFRRVDRPEKLLDGAVLLVGREVMRFEVVSQEERDAAPLVRHGVHMFGSPPREPWGRLMQLLPNGGVRDVRFLNDPEIVIGREEGDLVYEDDAFLSRRHAALRWQGDHCLIEDLRSSNGTFLRLRSSHELRAAEHVRLGDQLFRYEPSNR
jgi:pSer/pThr/pTyr-binding forkhead associated (FHA) protein